MAPPLFTSPSLNLERRRLRRRMLAAGPRRDSRALPYTEGQAVVGPGSIGPALIHSSAGDA